MGPSVHLGVSGAVDLFQAFQYAQGLRGNISWLDQPKHLWRSRNHCTTCSLRDSTGSSYKDTVTGVSVMACMCHWQSGWNKHRKYKKVNSKCEQLQEEQCIIKKVKPLQYWENGTKNNQEQWGTGSKCHQVPILALQSLRSRGMQYVHFLHRCNCVCALFSVHSADALGFIIKHCFPMTHSRTLCSSYSWFTLKTCSTFMWIANTIG